MAPYCKFKAKIALFFMRQRATSQSFATSVWWQFKPGGTYGAGGLWEFVATIFWLLPCPYSNQRGADYPHHIYYRDVSPIFEPFRRVWITEPTWKLHCVCIAGTTLLYLPWLDCLWRNKCFQHTQSLIIKNGTENFGNFKEHTVGRSKLRNA